MARLCAPSPWLSRQFLTTCGCYVKMSWGNCSVKVSSYGDFHDEQEGTAPATGGRGQVGTRHEGRGNRASLTRAWAENAHGSFPDRADRIRIATVDSARSLIAILLVLELGDIQRFPSAKHLASYFGLTPRVRATADGVRLGRAREPDAVLEYC